MAWDTELLNKEIVADATPDTPTMPLLQKQMGDTGVSESTRMPSFVNPETPTIKGVSESTQRRRMTSFPHTNGKITPNIGYDVIVQDEDTLSQGDRDAGDDGIIRNIQGKLNALGIDVGDVDGVIGGRTASGIQKAQQLLGLPRTGLLDRKTQLALTTLSPSQIEFFKNNPPSMAGYQNLGENVPVTAEAAKRQENITQLQNDSPDQYLDEAYRQGSDNIVETSLTANQNTTTLSKKSIENQVRELVGTNIRAAGILGAFSKEAGKNFDILEEGTNYSLANAEGVPFSNAKIQAALASLDPEVRKKIKKGGRDKRFGEALMSNYGGGGRYHGRGLIHISHDYNYKAVGDRIGVDLVANPDLVKDPRYAVPAALAFLEINGYFNTDREITRDSLHRIVNRLASNEIKNGRWANTQAYLRDWQGEAAVKTSPRPPERPEQITE